MTQMDPGGGVAPKFDLVILDQTKTNRAPFAYLVSRFPYKYETFILREVQALEAALGVNIPVFSLKPRALRGLEAPAREYIQRTIYPSPRRLLPALRLLFGSGAARRCVGEVIFAHRHQFLICVRAVVTLLLAAAMVPELEIRGIRHIHAHWATMPALAAYFIKRVRGISYSVTAHAWDIYSEAPMLSTKLNAAEIIVTCTEANRLPLLERGAPPARLRVTYHGLPFSALPPPVFARPATLRILGVGRLVEKKGFGDLLKACQVLRDRGIDFSCRIIGDGPLRRSLHLLVDEYELVAQVLLPGHQAQREVFAAYGWATVLCAPSVICGRGDRDGIPNVVLEAMSQGLPVVATCVSGISEVVHSGRTGLLIDPADPTGLATALEETLRDASAARRRAVEAYRLVRCRFDLGANTAELVRHLWNAASGVPGVAGSLS